MCNYVETHSLYMGNELADNNIPVAVALSVGDVQVWITTGEITLCLPGRTLAIYAPTTLWLRKDMADRAWQHTAGIGPKEGILAQRNRRTFQEMERIAWYKGANRLFENIKNATERGKLPTWEPITIGPVRVEFLERLALRAKAWDMIGDVFKDRRRPTATQAPPEIGRARNRKWRPT